MELQNGKKFINRKGSVVGIVSLEENYALYSLNGRLQDSTPEGLKNMLKFNGYKEVDLQMKELEVIKNYIKAYDEHFKVDYDKRTDETYKNLQKAGVELYLHFSIEFMDYSYKVAHKKCEEILNNL